MNSLLRKILFGFVFSVIGTTCLAQDNNRTVFVQLFEWPWLDVAKECETYLGPAGFAAVQVSPPHEHLKWDGSPWWERYQVVSYNLNSRSGNEAEFKQMISRCKAAGVDVYADAVINHMAGLDWGTSWLGRPFTQYNYDSVYDYNDFHHCGKNGNDDLVNFTDLYEIQNCELVNLADLKTESPKVQNRIAEYLNRLLDLGVAGFRIDAAKHIPAQDLLAIKNKLKKPAYIAQELIIGPGEPIEASDYTQVGDISFYTYPYHVGKAFKQPNFSSLLEIATWNVHSEDAIVFINNHDLERFKDRSSLLSNSENPQLYFLAQVFMLTWPYGYPQLYSGYDFTDYDQGPPVDSQLRTKAVLDKSANCIKPWTCEHRLAGIKELVNFRNHTNSHFFISQLWTNGKDQIAFSRGSKGFVAINASANSMEQVISTDLPSGEYCNLLEADCSKPIRVSQKSKLKIKLPPFSAVVIHD